MKCSGKKEAGLMKQLLKKTMYVHGTLFSQDLVFQKYFWEKYFPGKKTVGFLNVRIGVKEMLIQLTIALGHSVIYM